MEINKKIKKFTGIARAEGISEGEALVTRQKLSHLANAIDTSGVIRMRDHELMGRSYAGKIVVYDTDQFSTGGAWGLYYKSQVAKTGPKGIICRTVHPISIGGAIDARIPAVDGLAVDPCHEIKTGDWVRIIAPHAGGEAIIEIYPERVKPKTKLPKVLSDSLLQKKSTLKLTKYEKEMLAGKHGEAKKIAMQRLVKFGEGSHSRRMVRITSAHIFCDWKTRDFTIGAWPIYEFFSKLDAKVAVPTTVESTFMADDLLEDKDMPWHDSVKTPPEEVHKAVNYVNGLLKNMGAYVLPTCIPYMGINTPRFAEYHVTSESNHAAYACSMMGCRINRDPANMAFYSAITGVMPEYGMHIPKNRRGQMIFEVGGDVISELKDVCDYVALGGVIGLKAVDKVPVITGFEHLTDAQAKAFCACVSPALLYPMLHIVRVTPEARTIRDAFGGEIPTNTKKITITKEDVTNFYNSISSAKDLKIDAAIIGCPFLTLNELAEIAGMLKDKHVTSRLWLHTDYIFYSAAKKTGILQAIEKSGARVVHSVCPGMVDRDPAKAEKLTYATDSLKVSLLMSGIGWPRWWFGTREDVLNAAINGYFSRTRWLK